MPVFRFDKAFGVARGVRVFLNLECGVTRGTVPNVEHYKEQAADLNNARQHISKQKDRLKSQRLEIFQLKNELRAAKERIDGIQNEGLAPRQADKLESAGALPDFLIIGAQKCGTTSLYDLLTQHPLVEPAATKELHFFDKPFDDEGIKWYRLCFPAPRWKDGRRTITGEATPYYLFHPHAPRRMAKVVPQARLIALLRNPVDRAYSHYHQQVRRGGETLEFEEAIEAEKERLRGESEKMLQDERYVSSNHLRFSYLTRGIYADQLMRWAAFFAKEQMLVLKSEDFFEYPQEILQLTQDFLGLPVWEPEAPKIRKKGEYQQKMKPATRKRLEDFFEPHNHRLYEYLGRDLGW